MAVAVASAFGGDIGAIAAAVGGTQEAPATALRALHDASSGALWSRLLGRLPVPDALTLSVASPWHRRATVSDWYFVCRVREHIGIVLPTTVEIEAALSVGGGSSPSSVFSRTRVRVGGPPAALRPAIEGAELSARSDELARPTGACQSLSTPVASGLGGTGCGCIGGLSDRRWEALMAWAHALRGSRGAAWELEGADDALALNALLSEVDASIRPPGSQAFRLSLEGFDPEDVDDLAAGERDHIFTVGQDDIALYAGGARIGELFLSIERPDPPQEPGGAGGGAGGGGGPGADDDVEVVCLIGAPSAAATISAAEGQQLRPLTFHIYASFPPLARAFAASATVGAAEVLSDYPRAALGRVSAKELESLKGCRTVLVLLFVEM